MKRHKKKNADHLLEILDSLPGEKIAPLPGRLIKSPLDAAEMSEQIESTQFHSHKDTSCGKAGYESEKTCRRAIKNRLRRGGNTSRLRPYFCEKCHFWHMTSSGKRNKPRP